MNLPALDASDMYGYGHRLPAHCSAQLLDASRAHLAAMAPATPEEIESILRGLRSATLIRDENEKEARATMSLLRAHLAEVPLDILQLACHAYCNVPGRRFFPKSAGELRTFIDPLLHARAGRAARLRRLADQAHDEQVERDRLAADPCTPEGIAAVYAEFGLRRAAPAAATPSARVEPTVDDYLALGLTAEEAAAALEQRRRLLSRRPQSIGQAAHRAIDELAQSPEHPA